MKILQGLIFDAASEFEATTGKMPHNVYLGRVEVKTLKQWICEYSYAGQVDIDFRNIDRPVVVGLVVYEVNADTYIACA